MKVALIAAAILVVVGLVLLAIFFPVFQHWTAIHTGTLNEAGPYYGFWSGFGSDLGEVALLGAVITGARHLNCNNKGCWRMAHHTTANGHKLCKKCIQKPNAELDVHAIHSDHQ